MEHPLELMMPLQWAGKPLERGQQDAKAASVVRSGDDDDDIHCCFWWCWHLRGKPECIDAHYGWNVQAHLAMRSIDRRSHSEGEVPAHEDRDKHHLRRIN
ncbi:unnamed protein product [Rodentolepis nana]|uniref:Uncharacterized protein n=1 Tax=Rodentolepis nana TaxID=102285 RepID=A0A3P7V518_RODNA|nr:unnamed protein product [Rodentolepis nana]